MSMTLLVLVLCLFMVSVVDCWFLIRADKRSRQWNAREEAYRKENKYEGSAANEMDKRFVATKEIEAKFMLWQMERMSGPEEKGERSGKHPK